MPGEASTEPALKEGALGAMVPKRWAKRAVTRNAIKRQIYAVSAQFASQLRPRGQVVRLRAGFDRKEFISASSEQLKSAVRAELIDLFTRASAHPQLRA
jgi:ribonuclease P protein component